jgi:N-acetylmuramoyl-L-alanine amidase
MSDSGAPAFWPFRKFDPATFKVPQRKVTKVFLHCTASDLAFMVDTVLAEEVNAWHKKNGWRGIGYHYVIDKEGAIITARALEETPAAQVGPHGTGNIATIAFAVHGMWNFTEASMHAVVALCHAIHDAYQDEGKVVTFHGHREIDPRPCPVFDYKNLLGLDDAGNYSVNVQFDPAEIAHAATQAHRIPQEDR